MKTIVYIVIYFGTLPDNFDLWLTTCKYNPSIEWIVFTDDMHSYSYPDNVKVIYSDFEKIKRRIQSNFDFKISLDHPYRLCDYKVAYGEIFWDEIKKYDFWGYCDLDVMWGNIRKFLTDDILDKYTKIGFQGHSTIYKNTEQVNERYKLPIGDKFLYKEAFMSAENKFLDESGISDIYRAYNIPFYTETIFANISPLTWSFYIRYMPQSDDYKNKHQIFMWSEGNLKRLYVAEKQIHSEEYMYIHFLRRYMKISVCNGCSLVIYPNCITNAPQEINAKYIIKKGQNNMIKYYFDLIRRKKNKISFKNIYNYFVCRTKAKKQKKYNNAKIM